MPSVQINAIYKNLDWNVALRKVTIINIIIMVINIMVENNGRTKFIIEGKV